MQGINKIPLVSSEIAGVWNSYMYDSMAKCMLKHFLNTVEDVDARPVLEYALNLSTEHIEVLTKFINQESLPIPVGFSEDNDLNLNAPRLFDDCFYMIYLSHMARVGMERYALILAHTARSDLRAYFKKCLNEAAELYDKLADVRLSKGIFIRAPHIVVPKTVQFIEEKSFMSDWYNEKRPLVAREITQLFSTMLSNMA